MGCSSARSSRPSRWSTSPRTAVRGSRRNRWSTASSPTACASAPDQPPRLRRNSAAACSAVGLDIAMPLMNTAGAPWTHASGLQLDDFVDDAVVGDALAVPVVVQVRTLHGGGDEVGVKDRHALPALAAHAVVDDAVRAGAVPAARRVLAGGIAVRIVQLRPAAADVMEAALDVGQVAAHLQHGGRLARMAQEVAAV